MRTTPRIVETDDRIQASNSLGVEICGAYRPAGHTYWTLYVTTLVTDLTGMHLPPHREHFHGTDGHRDALAWIRLISTLYSLAA